MSRICITPVPAKIKFAQRSLMPDLIEILPIVAQTEQERRQTEGHDYGYIIHFMLSVRIIRNLYITQDQI